MGAGPLTPPQELSPQALVQPANPSVHRPNGYGQPKITKNRRYHAKRHENDQTERPKKRLCEIRGGLAVITCLHRISLDEVW